MVTVLDSEASGLNRGHCVVFSCKALYSHSVSLHPGLKMGTGEFNAGV